MGAGGVPQGPLAPTTRIQIVYSLPRFSNSGEVQKAKARAVEKQRARSTDRNDTGGSGSLLSTEVSRVLLGEMGPLLWQVIQRKDGGNRARRDAGPAVDALHGIDKQLFGFSMTSFIFFGVDAIDWTSVHTGGVLGADTRFCNHICHRAVLRKGIFSTLIVAQDTVGERQWPRAAFCYAGMAEAGIREQ